MIEDFLTNYIFEKLDKQIVNKIPYCLFFALLIYEFFNFKAIAFILTPIFFIIFIISSIYFNYKVSGFANKMWSKIDVKKVLGRMTDIYEKGDAYLKDMKLSKQGALATTGFLSGVTLTLTLTTVFLQLLYYIPLGTKQVIIPVAVIVAIFLLYDVAKGELIEEPEKDNNFTVVNDVMNTYLIENSSRKMSSSGKVPKMAFTFVTRVISPIIYYDFPKVTYKELFVYSNPRLRDFIKQLTKGHGNLRLKQVDGYSVDAFLVTEDSDNLSDLVDKLPDETFPYLLNPDYKFSDKVKKKWIALQVLKKQSKEKEPVGEIFIHIFRIPKEQPDRHNRLVKFKERKREVYMFLMMGERSPIQYIYTKVSAMSLQCQVNKVISEMEVQK
jgi:hypothetical protein